MWNESRYEDAARYFLILADFYPRSRKAPQSLYWAASLEHNYLKNHKGAVHLYERHLKEYPNGKYTLQTRENLAQIYAQDTKTVRKAISIYQEIIKDAPQAEKPSFLLETAKVALQHQLFLQARTSLYTLITKYPKSAQTPRAHYLAAHSYFLEGHTDLAIISFRKIAKSFPQHPIAGEALIFIADTLEQQGKMKQALSIFRQAEKIPHENVTLLKKRITRLQKRIRQGVR